MCITENCNKKARCRNLCQYHYHREMRHRYVDKGAEDITTENPHAGTLQAKKEYNDGLWEFVKKELLAKSTNR
jgi:hypothetical protein|tara:strand:- start:58 stop:276 length:219 start_codon:yes stop_codon:yes gene_type:complete